MGGQPRNRLAALDAAGAVTPWQPEADLRVNTMVVSGTTVYVGGNFTTIGGQPRPYLAAVDRTTGAVAAWGPDPNGQIHGLAVAGDIVYAVGEFNAIGGGEHEQFAALDAQSGLSVANYPQGRGPALYALTATTTTVYIGGEIDYSNGQPQARIAALDVATGAITAWAPKLNRRVYGLMWSGATLYAVGDFTSVAGRSRQSIAAFTPLGAEKLYLPQVRR